MHINDIPNGVMLLDKDGNILRSLRDYNNTHVCIIFDELKINDFIVVGKYANYIMPNYLPRNKGVYILVKDPEFDWMYWHEISRVIRAMTLANIIKYDDN